jgi:hypothetical protein
LDISARRQDNHFFHRYKILARDESVYTVELDSVSTEINKIYIESLGPRPVLPMAIITKADASGQAQRYIAEKEMGARKPDVRSINLSVHHENPVYIVRVKKSGHEYDVMIDAYDGDVLEAEEVD